MKISEIYINRPVFAWVMTLIVVLLGLVTGNRLQMRQYPNVSQNYIKIEMDYHGVGPEIIEMQITSIIEEAIAGIDGIVSITSTSSTGKSTVHMEIAPGVGINVVKDEVRDRLDRYTGRFPQDAQRPVLKGSSGTSEIPVIELALISKSLTDAELYTIGVNEIQHDLEAVSGVSAVHVFGAGQHTMNIKLDPNKLAVYNLTILDVVQSLRRQNVELPGGKIINGDREYVVATSAKVENAAEFSDIPIMTKDNMVIRLGDVGNVEPDAAVRNTLSKFNGEKIVSISVLAQGSANPIDVARGIKEKIKTIKEQLREGVDLLVDYDSTKFMENSLKEVYETIFEAVLLVVLVVFFFLRSMRAAIVPLVTIPVSLIGALIFMYAFNFSINNMTLMSMVLAIGLVVDDAIVILENIHKYIENGFTPYKAAIEGTREVSFAVIAMTLTLCAVYAPVALAKGVTGRWLTEFSITLASSVLLSGFVALTLSPMMCAKLLKADNTNQSSIMSRISQIIDTTKLLKNTDIVYTKALNYVLHKRFSYAMGAGILALAGIGLYMIADTEDIPYQDNGLIQVSGHAPNMSTLTYTQRYVDSLDKLIREIPEVESNSYTITNPTFKGWVILKDKRTKSANEIVKEIEKRYMLVPGIYARFNSGSGGGGSDSRAVDFVVRGHKGIKELRELTSNMVSVMLSSKIAQSILTSDRSEANDYVIEIDRNKASSLNIDPELIARIIDGLLRGSVASHFKKNFKMYDVSVEIDKMFKQDIERLFGTLRIKGHTEREEFLVPISEFVSISTKSGPVSILRYNGTRANSVHVILSDKCSLGDAIGRIKDIAKKNLPDDVVVSFTGDTLRYITESNTMMMIFFLALSFIYLVMAAQFESWSDPFIIMLSVPLALIGGIIGLFITGCTINVFSNIGFLTLIGLITKHGILIVDFANKLVDQGKNHVEAIEEAARRRLRPIMMTTFAMVLGSIPLSIASGAGCEIRIPLGVVIVFGMTIGSIFTIFLVPVFYTYIAPFSKRVRNLKAKAQV